MYQKNELRRKVLITPAEVVSHAPVGHTLDLRIAQQSIIVAEERFIRPALGYDLYKEMCDSKNKVITSGNIVAQQALFDAAYPDKSYLLKEGDVTNASEYMTSANQELWDYILWSLCAESVMLMCLAEGYVQFGSAGTIHNKPTSGALSGAEVVTPELSAIKWAVDKKMMDRIDPLREALHQFLCKAREADSDSYPLYKNHCDCDDKGVAYKRKSNILTNLYDDVDRRDVWPDRDPHRFPDSECCD